jgi:hypothetical protein
VKIKNHPYFDSLSKTDHWFSMLPELLEIENRWLLEHGENIFKISSVTRQPYIESAIALWHEAHWVAANDKAYFAGHALRSILERVAFLWATSKEGGEDPGAILEHYASSDRKRRRWATELILVLAFSKDQAESSTKCNV